MRGRGGKGVPNSVRPGVSTLHHRAFFSTPAHREVIPKEQLTDEQMERDLLDVQRQEIATIYHSLVKEHGLRNPSGPYQRLQAYVRKNIGKSAWGLRKVALWTGKETPRPLGVFEAFCLALRIEYDTFDHFWTFRAVCSRYCATLRLILFSTLFWETSSTNLKTFSDPSAGPNRPAQ